MKLLTFKKAGKLARRNPDWVNQYLRKELLEKGHAIEIEALAGERKRFVCLESAVDYIKKRPETRGRKKKKEV